MPIELYHIDTEQDASLKALLDSGYTRCLVSPALAEKLGICLRRLKKPHLPIRWISCMRILATFATVLLGMKMGAHSETGNGEASHPGVSIAEEMEPMGGLEERTPKILRKE